MDLGYAPGVVVDGSLVRVAVETFLGIVRVVKVDGGCGRGWVVHVVGRSAEEDRAGRIGNWRPGDCGMVAVNCGVG